MSGLLQDNREPIVLFLRFVPLEFYSPTGIAFVHNHLGQWSHVWATMWFKSFLEQKVVIVKWFFFPVVKLRRRALSSRWPSLKPLLFQDANISAGWFQRGGIWQWCCHCAASWTDFWGSNLGRRYWVLHQGPASEMLLRCIFLPCADWNQYHDDDAVTWICSPILTKSKIAKLNYMPETFSLILRTNMHCFDNF